MTKVKITRRRLNKGIAEDGEVCPLALAIKSVVKRGVVPRVGLFNVSFQYGDNWYMRKLNTKAQRFVASFDGDEKLEPTELSINIPKQLLK